VDRAGRINCFKFAANGPPQYLGFVDLHGLNSFQQPVELAPNKAAFISSMQYYTPVANPARKLVIIEFGEAA
jgi:hypothetical protein